ncbi:MAG: RDD family protein [Lachnospiraceae bacterium]|nr:RDD family protein [Lachnospiraceae bacterium]
MNQSVTKAGFFPRLGAYLVDSIIVGTVLLCLKMPVGLLELADPEMFLFGNVLFHYNIFDIIFYLLGLLYFVLTTSITGTTIGKRLFNLTVVDAEGKNLTFLNALYRESVGKFLSGIFYFGYIMIFIDKNNRAFHDYLCDSAVVYTCRFKVIRKVVGTQTVPAGSAVPGSQSNITKEEENVPTS